jgi:hypothetical protein
MARAQSHIPPQRYADQARGPFSPPLEAYAQHAAPSITEGAPVINPLGWSAHPGRPSNQEIPSAERLGKFPIIQRYTYPDRPPQDWYRVRDADEKARHSNEYQDADGWKEQKGILPGDKRWEYNPRLHPPAEDRPTMGMAPRTYTFTRPFDQLNRDYPDAQIGTARQNNGQHFSMADFRRDYPILGMAPHTSARNTYRITPAPWDANIVDMPPNVDNEPVNARVRSVDVPYPGRSYRLM